MSDNQNDRLKNFLKSEKLTQAVISKGIGMQPSTVGFNLNKQPLDKGFLEQIRKYLKISKEEWEKILEGEPDPKDKEIGYLKQINALQEHKIEALDKENNVLKAENSALKKEISQLKKR